MSTPYYERLLADVLSGRITDRASFDILRQVYPARQEELNAAEGRAISARAARAIPAWQRIYEQRKAGAEPASPPPPSSGEKPEDINLSRRDLDAILARRRTASPGELEFALAHVRELRLSGDEEACLRALASTLAAQMRVGGVAPVDETEMWIARVLGTLRTPFGDITRDEANQLQAIHLAATHAVQECQHHSKERCVCWRDAREQLDALRKRVGEKNPVGVAALAVWNTIEALARNRRVEEPAPPPANINPQQLESMLGRPVLNPYCWQFHKSNASYREHVLSQSYLAGS